jgi:hypothetical protein
MCVHLHRKLCAHTLHNAYLSTMTTIIIYDDFPPPNFSSLSSLIIYFALARNEKLMNIHKCVLHFVASRII